MKVLKYISILYFALISNMGYSQVKYQKVNRQVIDSLFNISYVEKTPVKELNSIKIQYKIDSINRIIESKKDLPFIYGVENRVYFNISDGKWYKDKNKKYWILKIKSEEALSLSIVFDTLLLPMYSELYIFNKNKDWLVGPIKSRDNPEKTSFATDEIDGNEITLFYSEPDNVEENVKINIKYIIHGFKKTKKAYTTSRATGSLASCYQDVYCLNGWEDILNSVVRLKINGGYCSGTLVNNTNQDNTPYILTAKHCVDNYPTSVDPNTIVFRFKYRMNSCGGSLSDIYYTMTGASIKKIYSPADAALLELNNSIPIDADLYFSGWDRSNSFSGYFYNISHPAAAEQQIASANHSSLPTAIDNSEMWYPEFIFGGNEPGSSGSALFDENKRIVGGSQTLTANAPCGPNLKAQYSKFFVIWNEFKDWLDPINSNVIILDGKYRCEMTTIKNKTINSNTSYNNCEIIIDNVNIENNANVIIDAEHKVIIEKDFETQLGTTLEIK